LRQTLCPGLGTRLDENQENDVFPLCGSAFRVCHAEVGGDNFRREVFAAAGFWWPSSVQYFCSGRKPVVLEILVLPWPFEDAAQPEKISDIFISS